MVSGVMRGSLGLHAPSFFLMRSVCVFNEASQEDFIRGSDDLGWLENLLTTWSLRTYAENCQGSESRN